MSTVLALAIFLWGIFPTVEFIFEFHNNPEAPIAQVGVVGDTCYGGFYEPWWDAATEQERLSVVAHEVGHCYGLPHYGDCNHFPTSMGCPSILPTPYDIQRLEIQSMPYRLIVGWSYDG